MRTLAGESGRLRKQGHRRAGSMNSVTERCSPIELGIVRARARMPAPLVGFDDGAVV
jgi:hypothetical protein